MRRLPSACPRKERMGTRPWAGESHRSDHCEPVQSWLPPLSLAQELTSLIDSGVQELAYTAMPPAPTGAGDTFGSPPPQPRQGSHDPIETRTLSPSRGKDEGSHIENPVSCAANGLAPTRRRATDSLRVSVRLTPYLRPLSVRSATTTLRS